jgi:Sulfatase
MHAKLARLSLSAALGGCLLLGLACAAGEERDDTRPATVATVRAGAEAQKVQQAAARRPHVVLVVLDEFPGDSLLDDSGRIDSGRYPNFAALARDSTWFRNAAATYDSTTKAVPLMLDGMRPAKGTEPVAADHPRSLFTALAARGYRVETFEEATAMCSPTICRGARTRRPAIIPNLNGGRPERFRRFVKSIRASSRPTLWMKHVLLPHGPYLYLPSGARTRGGARDLVPGMNSARGFGHPYLTRHNEQRYLLQLGFVDRLLGQLVRKLRRTGIYDDTLLVVTADHGFAWQVGVDTRRSVSPANVEELAPVPFFVKAPDQRRGRVSRAYAETLDVTPTIADALGLSLGYRPDGRSAFSRTVRRRRGVAVTTRDFSAMVRISGRRWEARRRAVVRRRLNELGSGSWASLYTRLGPQRSLLGQETGAVAASAPGAVSAGIAAAGSYARVRRASGLVPAQVAGSLRGGGAGEERDLAVAVNGRIEAVGRSFHLAGDATEYFGLNVPEAALREGRNRIEVFEVTASGKLRRLARS